MSNYTHRRGNPELSKYVGETIVVTDGNTLLGSDDKAGIAEIMSAAAFLVAHPEVKHGVVEFIFTSDEETGAGMNTFPYDRSAAITATRSTVENAMRSRANASMLRR
jgi:di/tripeptidase